MLDTSYRNARHRVGTLAATLDPAVLLVCNEIDQWPSAIFMRFSASTGTPTAVAARAGCTSRCAPATCSPSARRATTLHWTSAPRSTWCSRAPARGARAGRRPDERRRSARRWAGRPHLDRGAPSNGCGSRAVAHSERRPRGGHEASHFTDASSDLRPLPACPTPASMPESNRLTAVVSLRSYCLRDEQARPRWCGPQAPRGPAGRVGRERCRARGLDGGLDVVHAADVDVADAAGVGETLAMEFFELAILDDGDPALFAGNVVDDELLL